MGVAPYERFKKEELILRDELAIDRTILAHERTVLAYVRTVLALLVCGVSIVHLFSSTRLMPFGWTCLALAALITVFACYRYARMRGVLKRMRNFTAAERAALNEDGPNTMGGGSD